jgi:hypothetical protein
MAYMQVHLGVTTADAEDVEIMFSNMELTLKFFDYQRKPCQLVFVDVLAFRWQELDDAPPDLRNDATYEVTESQWLERQAQCQAADSYNYKHYMLCFNACGVLDVLSKPLKTATY